MVQAEQVSHIQRLRWAKVASLHPVGHSLGPNTGTAWGRQTGPHAPQIFNTLLSSMWEWKDIDAMQELPHADVAPMYARMRMTSLGPFATNSVFCRVFKPWAICYFPHHPTTRPHVTIRGFKKGEWRVWLSFPPVFISYTPWNSGFCLKIAKLASCCTENILAS